ncbi:MAG: hypothetical protein ACD_20C00026G0001, partial [uncultured bacterium]
MRLEKFTDNFKEGLAEAQSKALGQDNQFIEPVHLMLAMLEQKGTVYHVLQKAQVNLTKLHTALRDIQAKIPKVEGNFGEIHVSNDLVKLLNITDKYAQQRKDQFIASELFLLAAIDDKGSVGKALKDTGAVKNIVEQAINDVRGGNQVNEAGSESQRQALEKYTIDFT